MKGHNRKSPWWKRRERQATGIQDWGENELRETSLKSKNYHNKDDGA